MHDYLKPEYQDYIPPTAEELEAMNDDEIWACFLGLKERLSATGLLRLRTLMQELENEKRRAANE